jgi:hypothetical protein
MYIIIIITDILMSRILRMAVQRVDVVAHDRQ